MKDLNQVRQAFAEEIRLKENLQSEALVAAFAKVPREHFLGPGPWQIKRPEHTLWERFVFRVLGEYRTTRSADARRVYLDENIAIDSKRFLNNGKPSKLAFWIDSLNLKAGDRVLHVGCGVGYYTAIMAEVVGPAGHVTGIEIYPDLASRARENLAHLNHVEVVQGDGACYAPQPTDAIFINAGATQPRSVWIDSLRPGGRLILPLTTQTGRGVVLQVKFENLGYAAQCISTVRIFHCIGTRDAESGRRLDEALRQGNVKAVQSLRRDIHKRDTTCWFHSDELCFSTLPLSES